MNAFQQHKQLVKDFYAGKPVDAMQLSIARTRVERVGAAIERKKQQREARA